MVLVFILGVFLNAALLFLVQPMVGKLLLPKLGGTPAVWNTCLVFFQLALLAGYAYAWLQGRLKTHKMRVLVHLVFLGLAAVFLPISSGTDLQPPTDRLPTWWLLWTLLVLVGMPFIAISTTGPLLQRWFSDTNHKDAGDPYFLYAASNAGSLLGLLAYPFAIERYTTLSEQRTWWSIAYAMAAGLTLVCGVMAMKRLRAPGAGAEAFANGALGPEATPISWARRGLWVLLAAAPSSLSMGCAQHLTTDIAAMPLLWVAPLAVYLLSFVLAFSRSTQWLSEPVAWGIPIFAGLVYYMKMQGNGARLDLVVQFNLLLLLTGAWACHGRLAALRPHASRLTEYFVWVAVGGALGGMFNALLAPVIFNDVWEYPIAIGLVLVLGMPSLASVNVGGLDVGKELGVKGARAGTIALKLALLVGLGVWALRSQKVAVEDNGFVLQRRERTFFGVHRLATTRDQVIRMLLHGTTTHGVQFVKALERSKPRMYYHLESSVGKLMMWLAADGRPRRVAAVGLGTGTMAYYAALPKSVVAAANAESTAGIGVQKDEPAILNPFTFYEIDPKIVEIASDTRYFSYIEEAKQMGGTVEIVLGDARQTLARAPQGSYDVIVLDAFSSDAIPMHLLTKEAVAMYFDKLAPGGVLAMHVSNRHLDLAIMVRELAKEMGVVAAGGHRLVHPNQALDGMSMSEWLMLARTEEDAKVMLDHPETFRRIDTSADGSIRPWSDDYSNVFDVMKGK